MDEKWKLSKKESSSSKFAFTRSSSTRSTSSNAPLLSRSYSQKSSVSSSTSNSKCPPLPRSYSQKSSSISGKCSSLAKEHKARFYIMRRCVAMLVCWHKHKSDSWKKPLYHFLHISSSCEMGRVLLRLNPSYFSPTGSREDWLIAQTFSWCSFFFFFFSLNYWFILDFPVVITMEISHNFIYIVRRD